MSKFIPTTAAIFSAYSCLTRSPKAMHCMSWNPNERPFPSLSKDVSFKVELPPQLHHDAKHLGLQLLTDQGSSSSTESIDQPRDQCNSSESGGDEIYGNECEGQIKAVFLLNNLNPMSNPSHNSNLVGRVPYPYADPYFSGFLTAYGPQAMPHIVGIAPTRVSLPLDLAEDGPSMSMQNSTTESSEGDSHVRN